MDVEWSNLTVPIVGNSCVVNSRDLGLHSTHSVDASVHSPTSKTRSSVASFSGPSKVIVPFDSFASSNQQNIASSYPHIDSLHMAFPKEYTTSSDFKIAPINESTLCRSLLTNTSPNFLNLQQHQQQQQNIGFQTTSLSSTNNQGNDTSFAPLTASFFSTHTFLNLNNNNNNNNNNKERCDEDECADICIDDKLAIECEKREYDERQSDHQQEGTFYSAIDEKMILNTTNTYSAPSDEEELANQSPTRGQKRRNSLTDDEDKSTINYVSHKIKRMRIACNDTKFEVNITVKTLLGKNLNVTIELREKIASLKQRLAAMAGVPAEQQRLIYNGKTLADGRTFYDYAIKDGALIHMVLAVSGGGLQ
jgi:ubiquitin-like protein Nedd8